MAATIACTPPAEAILVRPSDAAPYGSGPNARSTRQPAACTAAVLRCAHIHTQTCAAGQHLGPACAQAAQDHAPAPRRRLSPSPRGSLRPAPPRPQACTRTRKPRGLSCRRAASARCFAAPSGAASPRRARAREHIRGTGANACAHSVLGRYCVGRIVVRTIYMTRARLPNTPCVPAARPLLLAAHALRCCRRRRGRYADVRCCWSSRLG